MTSGRLSGRRSSSRVACGARSPWVQPSRDLPLPPDTETQLTSFTELLATSIANAESRAELAQVAEEQAALGRVATLVAHGAAPEELFAAVTKEVGLLLGASLAGMGRYEGDERYCLDGVGSGRRTAPVGPGTVAARRRRSGIDRLPDGQSVRIGDYQGLPGRTAAFVRDELGIGSSVASPIVVEGHLWGVLYLHARQTHLPFTRDAESRLSDFTELVAAAIANAESRTELAQLAVEQAALGRVATLVARGVPPEEVFAAVTEEVGHLLFVEYAGLGRFDSRTARLPSLPAGGGQSTSFRLAAGGVSVGEDISTLVFETGRPARIDSYAEISDR